MGEIADMMIDGTMCQVCGVFLNEEAPGYPVTCGGCSDFPDAEQVIHVELQMGKGPKTVACPTASCERKFRTKEAAAQHWVDKHGED